MASTNGSEKTVSDAQSTPTTRGRAVPVEHAPAGRSACPECEGQVITADTESFCTACGLVVSAAHVDRGPTRNRHGPSAGSGPAEWSCESVNPLRIDNGLHTTFFLGSDGYGNSLSAAQQDKFGRLKRRHKRFQVDSKRAIRLNESFRDIEAITGNLALPGFVAEDAGRLLQRAADARLPGGHMSWEALAGGAVLLAATDAGYPRSCDAVGQYTKAAHERLRAAARKLRCELELDLPPAHTGLVTEVLITLDDVLEVRTCLALRDLAAHLMDIADAEPIGPGTPRLTVAAAAVYAADRLTPGKQLTQQQVAEAASTVVPTSTHRISRYNRELVDAYVAEHGTEDPGVVLGRELATLR